MLNFSASLKQYPFLFLQTWRTFFFTHGEFNFYIIWVYIFIPEIKILLSQSKQLSYCRSFLVLLCIYNSLFYSAMGSYKSNFSLPANGLEERLKSCGQPGLQRRYQPIDKAIENRGCTSLINTNNRKFPKSCLVLGCFQTSNSQNMTSFIGRVIKICLLEVGKEM